MASSFPVAPPPKSLLGRYRLLAPTAGIRVSPLCLGAMNFGDNWSSFMGPCDEATTDQILDVFYNQVCNFIDTANGYQFGDSERRIGTWMTKRGVRDQMVIATKYSTNLVLGTNGPPIQANYGGNATKSMVLSVNESLKRLQTDYIDLLYVHWWDYSTSIQEIMQSLNTLVQQGKVLYLGISDAPAWVVSKANEYARNHGLRPFSVYQGRWSAATRDFERDIIPMCRDEGMGLCPWGALGGGKFKTEEQQRAQEARTGELTEADVAVSAVLERIARRENAVLSSIALAYVLHKAPYVFPIVGVRDMVHIQGCIDALSIELTEEDVQEIEAAIPFDLGFPHSMLWGQSVPKAPQQMWFTSLSGEFDNVEPPKAIKPASKKD
ncbi:hypothetical protein VHEMI04586 [[Torrubiella] hemipterigena]|uniref:NADP-dependent oxidoreductase domain-containing protein n=1 Tax=[Torrubiella] hemipterigena TaxID=1531966 RepID=A0A0A1T1R1_9HYPO|nr:hypothetical protein VHEMI04586 [[Torrubiella] hemipterigena]